MSLVEETKAKIDSVSKFLVEKILGVNNERLEFIMDSFYKLDQKYRNALLGVIFSSVAVFIIAAISIYLIQVNSLNKELNDTFNALNEFKILAKQEASESARFNSLVSRISKQTGNISFKPFFEKLSRESNIPLKNINDRQVEMDPQNPLSQNLQEVHIDLKLSKISIPKLLDFLHDIERANKFLRVQNLKITGMYGNKLYFDVDILVRGYKAAR